MYEAHDIEMLKLLNADSEIFKPIMGEATKRTRQSLSYRESGGSEGASQDFPANDQDRKSTHVTQTLKHSEGGIREF